MKTREEQKARPETIDRLIAVAGCRDDQTGGHVRRINFLSRLLAARLRLGRERSRKIGISDQFLLKPTSLSASETNLMQTHSLIGHDVLMPSSQPLLKLVASIALSHHERRDGSGSPHGLRGESIPIEARIAMLADHDDALRSPRPSKRAVSHASAVAIITMGDQRTRPEHVDPEVLVTFVASSRKFATVYDAAPGSSPPRMACAF